MAGEQVPRWLLAAVLLALTFLFLALSAAGWGGWAALLANPARATFVVASLVFTVMGVLSPFNLSTGKREDASNRWILFPGVVLPLVAAWGMAYLDRRDRWVLDGDATRWVGVALSLAGGALRIWPIFVLGRRFSGLVAIQHGHILVTDGPYRWIRNPSYLGGLLATLGWPLVFRSGPGLILMALLTWLIIVRIDAEEALLASEFGAEYDAYRQRTWRLVPWVY
jgi:protein-S-isoprenylcysteine O-methyltransferase Ste14